MVIFIYLHYRYFASVATFGDVATTCPPLLNFTNNTNFQSLEVVDYGSETQLQVAEN